MGETQTALPPMQCPLLNQCVQLMHESDFHSVCNTKNWLYCKKAKAEADKYLHKPREWAALEIPKNWLQGKEAPKDRTQMKKEEKKRKLKFF